MHTCMCVHAVCECFWIVVQSTFKTVRMELYGYEQFSPKMAQTFFFSCDEIECIGLCLICLILSSIMSVSVAVLLLVVVDI